MPTQIQQQKTLGRQLITSNSLSGNDRKQAFQKLQLEWKRAKQDLNVTTVMWPAAKSSLTQLNSTSARLEKQITKGVAGDKISDAELRQSITQFNTDLKGVTEQGISLESSPSLWPLLRTFLPIGSGHCDLFRNVLPSSSGALPIPYIN